MEKKKKKNKRFEKLLQTVVPTLMIIICLSACVLPTYALSFGTTDGYVTGSGVDVIKANNDFSVTFLGTHPMSPSGDDYIYVSRDIMSGKIVQDIGTDNLRKYTIRSNDEIDRIEIKNQYFNSSNTLVTDETLVSRPIYGSFDVTNGGQSVGYDLGYVGNDNTIISTTHQVATARYTDYLYLSASYRPYGVVLRTDSMFFGAGRSLLPYGMHGVRPVFLSHENYWDNATYTFSCDVVGADGSSGSVNITGTISRGGDDFGYDCPLIPQSAYSEIYSIAGGICMLQNVKMDVRFTDYTLGIPTVSDSPSYSFYTFQDIIAGDNGALENGQEQFAYSDYDFNLRYFLNDRDFTDGGGGWQDGYDVGYDTGYDEGYTAGEIAGKATGYQDGLKDGQKIGYEKGHTDGYGDGYIVGEEAGDKAGYRRGYDEGYTAGDIAGYERGYEAGDKAGYSNGYTQGDIDGFARGNEAGYKRGYAIGFDAGIMDTMNNMNFTEWLGTAVGGFLDFTLFGNVTIGGILAVCIALALVMLFLKFFAGG